MDKLRILLPKGRIFDKTAALLGEAGFALSLSDRTYRPKLGASWLDAKIMKPQNVGALLELGSHDAGFSGLDWLRESGARVVDLLDLGFDPVRIVAAAPAGLSDLELRSKKLTVATEYTNIAKSWLDSQGYDYRILRTYGATEVFPPDDADLIVDNTASGQTLHDNGLRIIETLLESSTHFAASLSAMEDPDKSRQINALLMLFKAVMDGRERVMLEMNVPEGSFEELVDSLPAMRSPTISPLYGEKGGFAVKIAVKRSEVVELLPILKRLGASDIVEYALRKVVV